jgi:stearoyl-CoA desaturase (delta-9 desaturase)
MPHDGLLEHAASTSSGQEDFVEARRQLLDWRMVSLFVVIHLVALLGLWPGLFTWKAFFTMLVLQAVGGLATSIAMHRLIAHRAFKTWRWLEYVMAWVASLNWQGGPIRWAASHRLHHRFSDGPGDPQSPHEGFWWAHGWWNCHADPRFKDQETWSRYATDVARDPGHRFIDRHVFGSHMVLLAALYVFGRWPCVIWGEFVRLVVIMHATGGINAASHRWGYRRYDTPDDSRNLWWVALMCYGEWHHNHHAFPNSARQGFAWWELDVSYVVIRLLERLGLAWDVRVPSHAHLERAGESASAATVSSMTDVAV